MLLEPRNTQALFGSIEVLRLSRDVVERVHGPVCCFHGIAWLAPFSPAREFEWSSQHRLGVPYPAPGGSRKQARGQQLGLVGGGAGGNGGAFYTPLRLSVQQGLGALPIQEPDAGIQ